jgi:hypothetical protein
MKLLYAIYLYGIEFVSYFLATKFVSHMHYIDLAFFHLVM